MVQLAVIRNAMSVKHQHRVTLKPTTKFFIKRLGQAGSDYMIEQKAMLTDTFKNEILEFFESVNPAGAKSIELAINSCQEIQKHENTGSLHTAEIVKIKNLARIRGIDAVLCDPEIDRAISIL